MKPNRKVLLFRGSRSKEEILLNNSLYDLHIAQIIIYILNLDDSFFHNLLDIADRLKAIEDAFHLSKPPSMEKEDEFYRSFIDQVCFIIYEMIDNSASEEEKILFRLAAYLPCYESFNRSYALTERLRPKEPYLAKVTASESGSVIRQENSQINEILFSFGTDYAGWNQFINYLEKTEDEGHYLYSPIVKAIFGSFSGDRSSYASSFKAIVWELKRNQNDLQSIFVEKDNSILDELLQGLPGPRYSRNYEFKFPPSDAKVEKYNRIYEFNSFSELIIAELNLLNEINRPLIQCKLCGRFFVPYKIGSVYCNLPNPDYNGIPCSTIGSRLEYRKAHSFFDTSLGKQYVRNSKSYRKWVNTNRAFLIENVDRVYWNESDRDKRNETLHNTSSELQQNLVEWLNTTKEAIKKYENCLITEDVLESQIILPEIRLRSPLMWQFRDTVKQYDKG